MNFIAEREAMMVAECTGCHRESSITSEMTPCSYCGRIWGWRVKQVAMLQREPGTNHLRLWVDGGEGGEDAVVREMDSEEEHISARQVVGLTATTFLVSALVACGVAWVFRWWLFP